MSSTPSKPHYLALDGLRGVAALAVSIFHLYMIGGPILLGRAYLGVDFFFMLSGFVIACAYEPKLLAGMSQRRYLTARVIRIYPLVLLGTALGALHFARTISVGDEVKLLAFAAMGGLLIPWFVRPNMFANSHLPMDPPAWSCSSKCSSAFSTASSPAT